LWDGACHDLGLVGRDLRHYYWGRPLAVLGLSVALAAPLANTHADQGIRDWYQQHVRSRQTDEWARVGKAFGNHWITVPALVGGLMLGNYFDSTEAGGLARDWGSRSLRGLIVGAPSIGVLQYGLGASRPDDPRGSSWHPFRDNNSVSGHAFVGAIPFLAAASLTEHKLLQSAFVAGSFWNAWSRINDDDYYFSQAALGWGIAYIAVQSVVQTDRERILIVPLVLPENPGIGVLFRF
jgi:hypothetical protein